MHVATRAGAFAWGAAHLLPATALRRLDGATKVWILNAVLASAALATWLFATRDLSAVAAPVHLSWWMLVPAFYVAEICAIHVHVQREAHSFTLGEVALVLGLFLATPDELVLARVVAAALALGLTPRTRQRPIKLVFNLALFALETELAIQVFRAVAGSDPLGGAALAGAFLATVVAMLFSVAAVSLAISLAEGKRRADPLARTLALGATVTVTATSLGLIGVSLAWHTPMLAVLLVLPAAGVFLAYRAHLASQTRQASLQFLYETARLMHSSSDVESAIVTLLTRAREMFRAEFAELVLLPVETGKDAFRTAIGPSTTSVMRPMPADAVGELRSRVASTGQGLLVAPWRGRGGLVDLAPFRVKDAMVVPLRGEAHVIGTVVVANRLGDVDSFRSDDLTLLETLASHAGSLLETARLEKSLARLRDLMMEREELEAQLRHAQKMEAVGRLAGGVAHDFNNLLTVILGASHLALDTLPGDHELRGLLGDVRDAGERAAALTRQLLAFSRKQILQPRIVDLGEIVDRTQAMLSRLLGEEIAIAASLDADGDRVRVDPAQIEQVILNLAVNAKDAMPRGGTLTIETAAAELDEDEARQVGLDPGRYVRLAVSDTGSGMDEETQARIFEPFFTTKDQGKGTGLGLATVYGIVEQSGGRINVVSAVDEGTTFELYFPSLQAVSDRELGPVASGPLGGRETVLVVEDEEAVRRFVSEVFRSSGYVVLEARDGDEALALSRDHDGDLDLVVTDVVMPGLSGPELVSHLVEERPGTRVIFMSGYPDCALGELPGLAPSVPFVQKPFAPQTILARARDILDGRSIGLLSDIYPRSATTSVHARG